MNTQRFHKSKIYKIVNDDLPNMVYYGSTTRPLWKRFSEHKHDAFRKNLKYRVCSSTKLFEKGTPKIELVEEFKCNNKQELHKRERWYIENNQCINSQIPTRTHTEYMRYWRKKRKLTQNKDTPPLSSDHMDQSEESSLINIVHAEG